MNAIISFDSKGISGHSNHIDVHRAVKNLLEETEFIKEKGIKIYELVSVNLVRKFIGITDLICSVWNDNFIFLNVNPFTAWKAMKLHYSQFVWYRKLFVIFSRYAYINEIK